MKDCWALICTDTNRVKVDSHFEQILRHNFSNKPRNIFNMDETGPSLNNKLKIQLKIYTFFRPSPDKSCKSIIIF